MPSRRRPEWRTYGQLLLDDGLQVLLRISPQDAAQLARAGVALQAVTFDPKPLRPVVVEDVFPTVIDRDPPIDITANYDGTYYFYDWDTTVYANGSHTLRSRAVDDAGQNAKSEVVSVTVDNGGQPPIVYVYAIDMTGKQSGPNLGARAIVTIRDESGLPAEGATVYGSWSGDYIGDDTGTTVANGRVRFLSGRVQDSSATFTFTVTDVVKDGYTYDPDSNNETSDTIVVP
jgi:hypothetical protein